MEADRKERYSEKIVRRYVSILESYKRNGKLKSFFSYLKNRKILSRAKSLFEKTLPTKESIKVKSKNIIFQYFNPLNKGFYNLAYNQKLYYEYSLIRDEILTWLVANQNNKLTDLKHAVDLELGNVRKKSIKAIQLSRFEKINVEVLTVGVIALGGALALGSGSFGDLEVYFSDKLIDFVRNEKHIVTMVSAFLPAIALFLHEFDYILSLRKRRLNEGFFNDTTFNKVSNLEAVKKAIEIIEKEFPDETSQKAAIKEFQRYLNKTESHRDLIERLKRFKFRPIPLRGNQCEDNLG